MSTALLLTCREVTARLTDYEEGSLPPLSSLRVRLHLALCKGCRRFLHSLQALPQWMGSETKPEELDIAKAVLARTQAKLGQPRASRIPGPLAAELAGGGDALLRLMALTHLAFTEGRTPTQEPYLPPEILEQLPPASGWTWWSLGLRGARVGRIQASADGKQELMLLSMPGGRRFPAHAHLGRESALILHGGMDDGLGVAEPGEWRHYEPGHPKHAPRSTAEGCWALIRADAGGIRFQGWRGWCQGWLA